MIHSSHSRGYVIIIEVILFIAIAAAIMIGLVNPVLSGYASIRSFVYSKQSFLAADSGIEEALYRLKNGKQMPDSLNLSFATSSVTISVTNIANGKKITATGDSSDYGRIAELSLQYGTGVSFHYGIQAGRGGFTLLNSSSITGNAFASGPIIGTGNLIYGDIVSAGPTGLVDDVHVTGSAFAHTIQDSDIDGDAYYMAITGSDVGGTLYPDSPDQDPIPLPISDAQIAIWESDAEAGGIMDSSECDTFTVSSNTCTINSNMTLGPKKIPFNLLVKSSSAVLTITGPVWVTGNIETQTGPTIRMDSSLGSHNAAIIADDPANRLTGSLIKIGQTTVFEGSGAPGSFVFLISQNNSAEMGGNLDAISMSQGASAMVAYASHGQITLGQSVGIKEATAYKIILTNTANVTYDTGLPSVLFSAGPGGGYDHVEWNEI